MVLHYYKLREQPFGVTPGRGDLYASATHREALASLLYGIDSGLGFVALIGQPGMGKTTLLFEILRRLRDSTRTIFIFQTIVTPTDLLRALLIELGVDDDQMDLIQMQAKLNQILLEHASTGKRLVVIVDEAQNLDDSVLELLRMLSNFETACDKLMQIILSGQTQLREKLATPQLVQMRQRISIFAHLEPLSKKETSAYIDHRLRVAGYFGSAPLFMPVAVDLIARHSGGIPRNINNICFNALSLGCALDRPQIGADIIREVLKDLDLDARGTEAFRLAAEPSPLNPASAKSGITQPADGRFRVWKIAAAACCIAFPATGFLLGDRRIKSDAVQVVALRLASQRLLPQAPQVSDDEASADPKLMEAIQPETPESPSVAIKADPLPAPSPATPSQSTIATAIPRTRLVQVRAGQTLYSICRKRLKDLGPDCLDRIQELNPSLDLDTIQRGQRILLPVPKH